jgi:hypothetical protein
MFPFSCVSTSTLVREHDEERTERCGGPNATTVRLYVYGTMVLLYEYLYCTSVHFNNVVGSRSYKYVKIWPKYVIQYVNVPQIAL